MDAVDLRDSKQGEVMDIEKILVLGMGLALLVGTWLVILGLWSSYNQLCALFNKTSDLKSNCTEHPFKIGKNYIIRTVTMIFVGKLVRVYKSEIVLDNASWIAELGRLNQCFSKGLEDSEDSEIEPFNSDIIVGRGAIIDACVYNHPVPTEAK